MLNVFKNSTNLKDISYAYANIKNIKGDFTIPHDNITNAINCFYGRSNSNQLNIIANFGTTSHSAFLVGMTNAGNGQIYSYNDTANIVIFNMQTTNMANAFGFDSSVRMAACGPKVTDMSEAYQYCSNLKGSPACGPNVTNMYYAYDNCQNLTGSPVCGDKVTDMRYAFYNCCNLTGNPVCGPNVTDMYCAYRNCINLTGNPVCGPNVTNMYFAYQFCSNLTGSPVCGNNVSNLGFAYRNCSNLTGSPACGSNVTNMYCAYENCPNLYGDMFVYSDKISNATDCFVGRNTSKQLTISVNFNTISYNSFKTNNITGTTKLSWTKFGDDCIYYWNRTANIVIFDMQTTNMDNTFKNDTSVKIAACGPYVTNMSFAYYNCINLTGNPVCGNNVTNMYNAYVNCYNITGSPVCGNNVTDMSWTYQNCFNLTGQPVYGPNVTDMYHTYYNCNNLTGSPVCGDKVTNMSLTYYGCKKLTGNPVCGPNVETMYMTYYGCNNLTGSPVCGPNVTNMYYAYYGCTNLGSNGYFYSNKITGIYNCFYGRNTSKKLNLYVPANSTTLATCLNTSDSYSFTGANISWTNDTANNRYYSATQNIYIYPVANVEQVYKDNEE